MFAEEELGSCAKRNPLVPRVTRIPVPGPLVHQDRHDSELVVRLKENLLSNQKSRRVAKKPGWIVDRSAIVRRGSRSVLNAEQVIAAVPLQPLMTQTECVSIGCGNGLTGCALGEGSVARDDVLPRASKVRHGELADSKVEVFYTGAVTAHVKRIEVVNVDVLAAVVSFACPKPGSRLARKDIARGDERFTKPELVVAGPVWEICIAGGVCRVGLYHELRLHPGLIGIPLRVKPVANKNELAISFRFVSKAIFGVGPRRLERYLLAPFAVQTVARAKVPMKFETVHLIFQLRDS